MNNKKYDLEDVLERIKKQWEIDKDLPSSVILAYHELERILPRVIFLSELKNEDGSYVYDVDDFISGKIDAEKEYKKYFLSFLNNNEGNKKYKDINDMDNDTIDKLFNENRDEIKSIEDAYENLKRIKNEENIQANEVSNSTRPSNPVKPINESKEKVDNESKKMIDECKKKLEELNTNTDRDTLRGKGYSDEEIDKFYEMAKVLDPAVKNAASSIKPNKENDDKTNNIPENSKEKGTKIQKVDASKERKDTLRKSVKKVPIKTILLGIGAVATVSLLAASGVALTSFAGLAMEGAGVAALATVAKKNENKDLKNLKVLEKPVSFLRGLGVKIYDTFDFKKKKELEAGGKSK